MKQLIILLSLSSILFIQCQHKQQNDKPAPKEILTFNPALFSVKGDSAFQKARGQILYLPLYSNIPYSERKDEYDLSGFLTIHNTDMTKYLKVCHIFYFNSNGEVVRDFLGKDTLALKPLQSQSFFIPDRDKSGTGANFLVEWKTEKPINIPLIETVMLSLKSGQGVSFLSTGKVIEQMD